MKISVFTSNQPRHLSLINSLSNICDDLYAVQECNTVFPGEIKDFFNNSKTMNTYFSRVRDAEKKIFGEIGFFSNHVHQLALKCGDLSKISRTVLEPALHSDFYIVFGASYIRGWLANFLVENKAINIHMGVSPYYRGSSCNFWAIYDGNPELVGATIHLLSKGLDSGDILYHALPKPAKEDPFLLGMRAVKTAHDSLAERIRTKEIFNFMPLRQNKDMEYRYTRNSDFNDLVAQDYLDNILTCEQIFEKLQNRDMSMFRHPYIS